MCDTRYAVGIYGGCGLFYILSGMAWCCHGLYRENNPEAAKNRLALGCVLGFIWMIGAAFTGGVFAIGWVFLLWGVPIFLFATYMIKTHKLLGNFLTCLKSIKWTLRNAGRVYP